MTRLKLRIFDAFVTSRSIFATGNNLVKNHKISPELSITHIRYNLKAKQGILNRSTLLSIRKFSYICIYLIVYSAHELRKSNQFVVVNCAKISSMINSWVVKMCLRFLAWVITQVFFELWNWSTGHKKWLVRWSLSLILIVISVKNYFISCFRVYPLDGKDKSSWDFPFRWLGRKRKHPGHGCVRKISSVATNDVICLVLSGASELLSSLFIYFQWCLEKTIILGSHPTLGWYNFLYQLKEIKNIKRNISKR